MSRVLRLLTVISILIISMTSWSAASGKEKDDCVLPAPDYNDVVPSKPQLEGEIVSISVGIIEVEIKDESRTGRIKVRIDDKTQLFTVYGGYVSQEKLAVGQYVHVWFVGCKSSEVEKASLAAVVQLESK